MKQLVFSVLLIITIIAGSCNSSKNNDFIIPDAKNIALNLTSAMQRSIMNVDYYYEGKLRIISIPGEIVTGIDFEEDGIFDLYFYLQTNVDLKINEEIENGQIMFAQTCLIVNNTKHDFIKCFTLGKGNKKASVKSSMLYPPQVLFFEVLSSLKNTYIAWLCAYFLSC